MEISQWASENKTTPHLFTVSLRIISNFPRHRKIELRGFGRGHKKKGSRHVRITSTKRVKARPSEPNLRGEGVPFVPSQMRNLAVYRHKSTKKILYHSKHMFSLRILAPSKRCHLIDGNFFFSFRAALPGRFSNFIFSFNLGGHAGGARDH